MFYPDHHNPLICLTCSSNFIEIDSEGGKTINFFVGMMLACKFLYKGLCKRLLQLQAGAQVSV